MTYVTEQTPQELRAHMRRLQAMPGWHNPLDDRLYEEILALDAEIAQLRAAQLTSTDTQGISDEQIAAAVRPLYADDKAASMGLADDNFTARAVLSLRPEPTVEQAIAYLKIALRDSKGWTMDYSDAIIRDAIDRAPEAAMEEMRTAKQMSAEYLQGFEDGASHIPPPDCDQAFEEKYKTSSRDPSNEGDLAKFRDGWNAAQQELPRSYCGSTFDTRPFGAGATVRLHFSDSEEAEKWWVSITGRR